MAALEREGGSGTAGSGLRSPSPSSSPARVPSKKEEDTGRPRISYAGTHLLLLVNIGLFVVDHVLHWPGVQLLYLNHTAPTWWSFATSTFCHASYAHLSSTLFVLYVFGKLVEEEEGPAGVVAAYVITGVGASLASLLLLPAKVQTGLLGLGAAAVTSLGASGAVFGLFAVAALLKLRPNLFSLVEFAILGQFVVQRVVAEVQMAGVAGGVGAGGINHVAHIAGALGGVLLIALLRAMLPAGETPP